MNQLITTIIDVKYSGLKNPLDIEQKLKTGDRAKVSVTYEVGYDTKHLG